VTIGRTCRFSILRPLRAALMLAWILFLRVPSAPFPLLGAESFGFRDHTHRTLLFRRLIQSHLLAHRLPLEVLPHILVRAHRFEVRCLEHLTEREGADHLITSGISAGRGVIPDDPVGHGLSVGVIAVGFHLGADGLHLLSADIRNPGDASPGHGHKGSRAGHREIVTLDRTDGA